MCSSLWVLDGRVPRCAGSAVTRPDGRGNPSWVDSRPRRAAAWLRLQHPRKGHVGSRRSGATRADRLDYGVWLFGVVLRVAPEPLSAFMEREEAELWLAETRWPTIRSGSRCFGSRGSRLPTRACELSPAGMQVGGVRQPGPPGRHRAVAVRPLRCLRSLARIAACRLSRQDGLREPVEHHRDLAAGTVVVVAGGVPGHACASGDGGPRRRCGRRGVLGGAAR